MTYRDKALDNPINWSFKLGRLFAIDIRLHITFIIGAVILVAMELPDADSGVELRLGKILVDALGSYALLFIVVLVHEFGHCWGARHTGGDADEILLWPLGGLAYVNPPHDPRAHMVTTLAGPMVNVIFCGISSVVLVAWIGSLGAVPWNPLHPVSPIDPTVFPTTGQFWLMRFFGISYVLLIINMFPIFPFDGGRVMQAWFWPTKGYRGSMELATGTGMVGAVIVGLFGLLVGEWLLMMIAVFGYITCWQTRKMLREQGEFETGFGAEFSGGYTFGGQDESTPRKPGYFARRRARKIAQQAQRDRESFEQHRKRVEEALRQVSLGGMESLTDKQRRILQEETERRRGDDVNAD